MNVVRLRVRGGRSAKEKLMVAYMFGDGGRVLPEDFCETDIRTLISRSYQTVSLFRMCFGENFHLGPLSVSKYIEMCERYGAVPFEAQNILDQCVALWTISNFLFEVRGRMRVINYFKIPEPQFQRCIALMVRNRLMWIGDNEIIYGLPLKQSFSTIAKCIAQWRWVVWETSDYRYSSRIENCVAAQFVDQNNNNGKNSVAWMDAGRWWCIEDENAFPLGSTRRLKSNRIVVWNAHFLSVYEVESLMQNINRLWCKTIVQRKSGTTFPIHICFVRDRWFRGGGGGGGGEKNALDLITRFLSEKFSSPPTATTTATTNGNDDGGVRFASFLNARTELFPLENEQRCVDADIYQHYRQSGYLVEPTRFVATRFLNGDDDAPISFCNTNEFEHAFWPLYDRYAMIFISVVSLRHDRSATARHALNTFVYEKKLWLEIAGRRLTNGQYTRLTYKTGGRKSSTMTMLWRIQNLHEKVSLIDPSVVVPINPITDHFELAECISFEELRRPVPFVVIFLDEFRHHAAEQCMTRNDMYDLLCMVTVKTIFIGSAEHFPFLNNII